MVRVYFQVTHCYRSCLQAWCVQRRYHRVSPSYQELTTDMWQRNWGYTPGMRGSTSTANATVSRFAVLSARATNTASHIVFQWNKKIGVVIVNSDEDIACGSTVGTIRSVTSTVDGTVRLRQTRRALEGHLTYSPPRAPSSPFSPLRCLVAPLPSLPRPPAWPSSPLPPAPPSPPFTFKRSFSSLAIFHSWPV
jgi:hypothetical protein